jgi:uncharacterized protein (TIGR02145 family)
MRKSLTNAMANNIRPLLAAALGLALAFTFSCSSDDDGGGGVGGGGEGGSSSNVVPSSSSLISGSSSSLVQSSVAYGTPVTYGGETYQTVVIGTQTWMARNLNYYVDGSVCYDNDPANCAKYGRLYNWATAMALDTSCNSEYCNTQIDEKHRGICPSGWQIPLREAWITLRDYLRSDHKYNCSNIDCITSYMRTEAESYGFSVLSVGSGNSDGSFKASRYDNWWSATNFTWASAYTEEFKILSTSTNRTLHSVRCVKEDSSPSSSLVQPGVVYGTPVHYEGETYNCTKYGSLYNWATAMALPDSCSYNNCSSQIGNKHRGICATGWHIPSKDEWDALSGYIKSDKGSDYDARHLRTTSGWHNDGNGLDSYGFAALPGGNSIFEGCSYIDEYCSPIQEEGYASIYGTWWSATEYNASYPYSRSMSYNDEVAHWWVDYDKYSVSSVRCIKD